MFRDADAREGGAAMTGLWRVRLVRLCVCDARRSRSEPSDAAAAEELRQLHVDAGCGRLAAVTQSRRLAALAACQVVT